MRIYREQVRRIRRLLLVCGAVALAWGLLIGNSSRPAFRARVWLSGYRGCMCEDCAAEFIGQAVASDEVWLPDLGCGNRTEVAIRLVAYGGGLLCIAGVLRRVERGLPPAPTPDACPSCHYPRTGLKPGAVCPECGTAFTD